GRAGVAPSPLVGEVAPKAPEGAVPAATTDLPSLVGSGSALELEVPVTLAGLVEPAALLDLLADPLLRLGDLLGDTQDLVLPSRRNDQDAVRVAHQHVAGLDPHLAQRHRDVGAVGLHAILARAHVDAAAEDRVAELQASRRVAADTVDHG